MNELTPNQRLFIEKLPTYPQSPSPYQFRDAEGYNCLGVACDLSDLGDWHTYNSVDYTYLGQYEKLPTIVVRWLHLNDRDPIIALVSYDDVCPVSASDAAEDYGWDFTTIAKLFEYLFTYGEPATVGGQGNILR